MNTIGTIQSFKLKKQHFQSKTVLTISKNRQFRKNKKYAVLSYLKAENKQTNIRQ